MRVDHLGRNVKSGPTFRPMWRWLTFPILLFALPAAGQGTAPVDTGAIIANIDQYMMLVDRLPVMAAYARMSADGQAEPLEAKAQMPPGCLEFIQLLGDSTRKVMGAVIFKAPPAHEVKEASYFYFDRRYNTVSIRHELKWLDNHCTFSYAVQNDFEYFFPPRNPILQYTTLTDVEGTDLTPWKCAFPPIERSREVYYHLDMLLLMERVKM